MDINDPRWETYEKRFMELAERAELVNTRPKPSVNDARYFLCLYGENGLTPEEEFEFLEKMARENEANLKKIEVETDYWQDTVLYIP